MDASEVSSTSTGPGFAGVCVGIHRPFAAGGPSFRHPPPTHPDWKPDSICHFRRPGVILLRFDRHLRPRWVVVRGWRRVGRPGESLCRALVKDPRTPPLTQAFWREFARRNVTACGHCSQCKPFCALLFVRVPKCPVVAVLSWTQTLAGTRAHRLPPASPHVSIQDGLHIRKILSGTQPKTSAVRLLAAKKGPVAVNRTPGQQ